MEEKPRTIVYKGTKYTLNRGYYKTTQSLHKRIWEDNFGEVPKDHHIHHKNGDSGDNRFENLECMHKAKHHSLHFKAMRQVEAMHSKESRLKALEWYRSKLGRKTQGESAKKGWKDRKSIKRKCVICEKDFLTKHLGGTKYCSQPCRSRCQSLREQIAKKCLICSSEFQTRNYSQASKTCSQKCKGKLISRTKMGCVYDPISTVKR